MELPSPFFRVTLNSSGPGSPTPKTAPGKTKWAPVAPRPSYFYDKHPERRQFPGLFGVTGRSLRLDEQADEPGRALDVAIELRLQLGQRQARRQVLGVEIGADDHEGVVVRRAGRGARSGIVRDALRALAADVFRRFLGHLAFREGGDVRRNAIGNPVEHTEAVTAFRIDHRKGEALGAFRRARPGKLGRYVVADAIRVLRPLVCN